MVSPQVYFFQTGERLTEDLNGPDLGDALGAPFPSLQTLMLPRHFQSPSLAFWGGFNSLLAL